MLTTTILAMLPMLRQEAKDIQGGLESAKGFKHQFASQTLEIEGVCKITESEVSCWTPDGKRSSSLTKEIEAGLKNADSYNTRVSMQYRKKNRLLILKTTTHSSGSSGINGQPEQVSYDYSKFVEGWGQQGNSFRTAQSSGFDGSNTTRQVILGAFEAKTTTFPFRYTFQLPPEDGGSFDFEKGKVIKLPGLSLELADISDKQFSPADSIRNSFGKDVKHEICYVKIRGVDRPDKYKSFSLSPISETGEVIGYVDDKGNPITQKQMNEANSGGGFFNYGTSSYASPISIGDGYYQTSSAGDWIHIFPVGASKIKSLHVSITKRRILQFDNIRLDPR